VTDSTPLAFGWERARACVQRALEQGQCRALKGFLSQKMIFFPFGPTLPFGPILPIGVCFPHGTFGLKMGKKNWSEKVNLSRSENPFHHANNAKEVKHVERVNLSRSENPSHHAHNAKEVNRVDHDLPSSSSTSRRHAPSCCCA
jgi:hypothetical protein